MLTAGLVRVELAPEEYQLYSEGCEEEEEMEGEWVEEVQEEEKEG